MSRMFQIAIVLVVIGIIAFFAFGLRFRNELQPSTGVAPDFTITSFDGKTTYTLSQLKGKVVVINFWASWCIPCRDEAALLEKTWKAYKDRGVVFIGIDWSDPEPDALKYIAEFKLTYFNGRDLGTKIGQQYRIKGVPETYFIGKDGTVRGNSLGPITPDSGFMTEAQFTAKLDALLGE